MLQSLLTIYSVNLFETLETIIDLNISIIDTIVMIIVSFIAGLIISTTYMKTSEKGNYQKNFALTMVLLPALIASIVLLIGSNIARAFSLAGAFAIIRFRSDPAEPKDIAYVLFSMSAGLAFGITEYVYGITFTIILCLVMYLLSKTNYGSKKKVYKELKITIPEDLDYDLIFKEVFEMYQVEYHLVQVKTASLGSLYKVYYDVIIKNDVSVKAFIDELRIRNSNLDISLSEKSN